MLMVLNYPLKKTGDVTPWERLLWKLS